MAESVDQHSVAGVVSALKSSLSQEVIARAREFDDQMLSAGRSNGQRAYLVTDQRSRRVNDIATKLLVGMHEPSSAWVVRVLDTDPVEDNAFVLGGQYVYVFTGVLQHAQSDDELAFVIGHELGHSILKHGERRQSDTSMQLAQLIALIGAVAKGKTADSFSSLASTMHAKYSQQDEAEADALGAAIALKAGFDPLRGVDFFTRAMREHDKANPVAALSEAQIVAMRNEVTQLQATCVNWKNAWNARQIAQTQENADKVNGTCRDFETKRVAFNEVNQQFYNAQMQQTLAGLASSHPDNQSRVAALAATVDFLAGRREVASLASFRNACIVMQALQATNSPLLSRAPEANNVALSSQTQPAPEMSNGVAARFQLLKQTFDAGLITREEFEAKRAELLRQL
jgi:predicted Zn-dependent protease